MKRMVQHTDGYVRLSPLSSSAIFFETVLRNLCMKAAVS